MTGKGITYLKGDIQALINNVNPSLQGRFDAVFSSATFHWCKANPGGVIDSVKWLLKPGGRLVFELGGFGNWSATFPRLDCWISTKVTFSVGVRGAIHEVLRRHGVDPIPLDPWYFPTVAQYNTVRSLLAQ